MNTHPASLHRYADRETHAHNHVQRAQLRLVKNQRRAKEHVQQERKAIERMRSFRRWALFWRVVFWFGLALALSVAATRCAQAQNIDYHLIAHGFSHHSLPYTALTGERFNERNWGAGIRAQFNADWSTQAGAYRNSFNRRSVYLITDYTPVEILRVRTGLFAGTINHYPDNQGRFVPGAGVILRAQVRRASIALRAIPPLPAKRNVGVLSVEFGWRL